MVASSTDTVTARSIARFLPLGETSVCGVLEVLDIDADQVRLAEHLDPQPALIAGEALDKPDQPGEHMAAADLELAAKKARPFPPSYQEARVFFWRSG